MKILTEGYLPKPEVLWYLLVAFECHRCHSVFQIEPADKVNTINQRHPGGIARVVVHCPKCNTELTFNQSDGRPLPEES